MGAYVLCIGVFLYRREIKEMKGDFTGFTFVYNGHSYMTEDLGITRVSDGDRYNEPLIPEIEDKTIEIPGLDGSYFYGSNFKSRNFSIKIAYDEMTEVQFRLMRQIFGYKHTGLLIFDEAPYKKYRVKIASPPELDFVCFDERGKTPGESRDGIRITDRTEREVEKVDEETGETTTETVIDVTREQVTPWVYSDQTNRIYKGEGTIEFVAYYPFAIQVFKTLNEYEDEEYPNKAEWAAASRLLESIDESTELDIENGQINLYNAGDVDMGFSLYVPFSGDGIGSDDIELLNSLYSLRILQSIKKKGNDIGFLINTVNGLVEGIDPNSIVGYSQVRYDTLLTSGNIYNEYAIGEFFKVAPGGEDKTVSTITLNGGIEGMKLYYNYLYF